MRARPDKNSRFTNQPTCRRDLVGVRLGDGYEESSRRMFFFFFALKRPVAVTVFPEHLEASRKIFQPALAPFRIGVLGVGAWGEVCRALADRAA